MKLLKLTVISLLIVFNVIVLPYRYIKHANSKCYTNFKYTAEDHVIYPPPVLSPNNPV